jgi:hypothetical protein
MMERNMPQLSAAVERISTESNNKRRECIEGLQFHWFITHDRKEGRLPALAEMELLQAHFDEFKCLPAFNESA